MFKERLISGILLVVGIGVLIYVGGFSLWLASLMVGLVGMYELYGVVDLRNDKSTWITYPIVVLYYVFCNKIRTPIIYISGVTVLVMSIYVLAFPHIIFKQKHYLMISVLYVGILSSCLYLVRMSDNGLYYAWIAIISSWGSDTAAYCVGKKFGKYHPFPTLSPKKTTEGCRGGIIGAAALAALLAYIMKQSITYTVIITIVASAFSIIGDLCASAIKRQHDKKDYGNIIPGHGGVLDRFDSLLFTGAVIFICLELLF